MWQSIQEITKFRHQNSFNGYCPVTLTPTITKCLERLTLKHIQPCLPHSFDPQHYAHRANRSTEDTIAITLR